MEGSNPSFFINQENRNKKILNFENLINLENFLPPLK